MSKEVRVTTLENGRTLIEAPPVGGFEVYGFVSEPNVWLIFDAHNFAPRVTWRVTAALARDFAAAILAVVQEREARRDPVAEAAERTPAVATGCPREDAPCTDAAAVRAERE